MKDGISEGFALERGFCYKGMLSMSMNNVEDIITLICIHW